METMDSFRPTYQAFLESNLTARDFCKQVGIPERREQPCLKRGWFFEAYLKKPFATFRYYNLRKGADFLWFTQNIALNCTEEKLISLRQNQNNFLFLSQGFKETESFLQVILPRPWHLGKTRAALPQGGAGFSWNPLMSKYSASMS